MSTSPAWSHTLAGGNWDRGSERYSGAAGIDGGGIADWGQHGYNSAVLGADKHASADYGKWFNQIYPGNSLANLWPWPKEPQWYADVRTEYRNKFVNA